VFFCACAAILLFEPVFFFSKFLFAALCSESGLPDGLFSNQKSQFGKILEDLRLENVDVFYGHLKYFIDIRDITYMAIWYILCLLGTFFPFWYQAPRKIWQPCSEYSFIRAGELSHH
jgi:hypothetical protein